MGNSAMLLGLTLSDITMLKPFYINSKLLTKVHIYINHIEIFAMK